jgi:hypothetical protein
MCFQNLALAAQLGAQQLIEDAAGRRALSRRLARIYAPKVEHVIAAVGAAVPLNVPRAKDDRLAGAHHVSRQIQFLSRLFHESVELRVQSARDATAAVGAVAQRSLRDGQQRHGQHTEAHVVNHRHQRKAQPLHSAPIVSSSPLVSFVN